MSIWVHTLVKNEERYIWFALMSVIAYVDRIIVWDTGSSDSTVDIVKNIKRLFPNKIDFKEVGEVDIYEFTKVRQDMLKITRSDWFMMLDGDEVWWNDAIKSHVETITENRNSLDMLVTKYYNIVGDIYHFQDEKAGKYSLDGIVGHHNLRFINRHIPGLHFDKPHGQQGLFDGQGTLIQDLAKERRLHLGFGYLHFTNVVRSSSRIDDLKVPKRDLKLKFEKGTPFAGDFYYPEVFFKKRPDLVPSPWQKTGMQFNLQSLLITPLKHIKRNIKFKERSGY